jgi:TonB family protein
MSGIRNFNYLPDGRPIAAPVRMPGDYYIWAAEGKDVSIYLSFQVIERLSAAAHLEADSFGVLLGRALKHERSRVIIIDDFEVTGPAPATLSPVRERQPVGLYHARGGTKLHLDQRDAAAVERAFHSPELVYLLIQPSVGEPARAAFFVQENAKIEGFTTIRDFPFHSEILRSGAFPTGSPPHPRFQGSRSRILGVTALGAIVLGSLFWMLRPAHPPDPVSQPYAENIPPTMKPAAAEPQAVPPESKLPQPQSQPQSQPQLLKRSKPLPVLDDDDDYEDRKPPRKQAMKVFQSPAPTRARTSNADRLRQPVPASELPVPPEVQYVPAPAERARVRRLAVATVAFEPVAPSLWRRAIAHIPGVRAIQRNQFKAGEHFVAARPARYAPPTVPERVASRLRRETPIDLKVRIGENGRVSDLEILPSSLDPELTRIAADAAERWHFTPANLNQHPVASDMILHFRFHPAE